MDMPQSLEERVNSIEQKIAQLTDALGHQTSNGKSWRKTFGLSKNDAEFEEMIRLGKAYRKRSGNQKRGARS